MENWYSVMRGLLITILCLICWTEAKFYLIEVEDKEVRAGDSGSDYSDTDYSPPGKSNCLIVSSYRLHKMRFEWRPRLRDEIVTIGSCRLVGY